MTRNTQVYRSIVIIADEEVEIMYRDLTVLELSFIKNINIPAFAEETAGRISILNVDPTELPWAIVIQIGQNILGKAYDTITNETIHKGLLEDFKNKVKEDGVIYLIIQIKKVFPTESILSLLNLTYKDLLELTVLAEIMSGTNIISDEPKQTNKRKLVNPNNLPDGGKALQESISRLNEQMGF